MTESESLRKRIVETCPVHDNNLYAYEFDSRTSVLVMRTMYPHADPREYTDVWFTGVWCHHLECVLGGDIIFDMEGSDLRREMEINPGLFERLKNQGWPRIEKRGETIDELIERRQLRVWHIQSSYGLDGFVIARERLTFQNQQEAPSRTMPGA